MEARDNNLYTLLKSQWAHRYGVESLEELKNLDETYKNQNDNNEESLKNEQSKKQKDFSPLDVKETYLNDDDNQEKEVINNINKEFNSVETERKEYVEAKSYEIDFEKNYVKKTINNSREYISAAEVEALIPLPPKPKYSYLGKWILR